MESNDYLEVVEKFAEVTTTVTNEQEFWNSLLSKADEIFIVLLVIANLICIVLIYIIIHNMLRRRKP